jgi:hypothetical protein
MEFSLRLHQPQPHGAAGHRDVSVFLKNSVLHPSAIAWYFLTSHIPLISPNWAGAPQEPMCFTSWIPLILGT